MLPAPRGVVRQVDEAWKAFLSAAFLAGKKFGTEVVFTYGPWGFLLEPRSFPGIYPWVLLGRFLMISACSLGLALLALRWIEKQAIRIVWGSTILLFGEPAIMLMPILVLLLWHEPTVASSLDRVVLHALATSSGLAANTKVTVLILLAALLLCIIMIPRGRSLCATAVVSWVGFWLLAGQDIGGLPSFLTNSAAIVAGYNAAMSIGRATFPTIWGVVILCGFPALAVLLAEIRRPSFPSIVLCGWFLFFELMFSQQAITRADKGHILIALVNAAFPVALALLPCPHIWPRARVVYSRLSMAVVLLTGLYLLCSVLTWNPDQTRPASTQLASMRTSYRTPRRTVTATPSAKLETVHVFPWDLSFALQKEYPLQNLPVIQSYAAFSPYLTNLNARFIASNRAPARVYFEVSPIDLRYPTLEDPLVWRTLLTHYEPSVQEDNFLVLRRRVQPRHFATSLVLSRRVQIGESVQIPSDLYSVIWSEVKVNYSPAARLFRRVLPTQQLAMNVQTASHKETYAFLEQPAAGGFLLSPLIANSAAMEKMYRSSPADAGERVESITFTGSAYQRFLPTIEVRLYAVQLVCDSVLPRDNQHPQIAKGPFR